MDADAERPAHMRCRSCGAPIIMATSATGSKVPLDAEPCNVMANGHYAIDWPSEPYATPRALHRPAIHLTHFATCPNAAEHRRR